MDVFCYTRKVHSNPHKKILFLLGLVVLLFAGHVQAAKASTTTIRFDEATLLRGYTIVTADGSLKIGIPPNMLQQPSTLTIEQQPELFLYPESGATFAEPIRYSFTPVGDLSVPMIMDIAVSASVWQRQVLFRPAGDAESAWQELPTTTLRNGKLRVRPSAASGDLIVVGHEGIFPDGVSVAGDAAAVLDAATNTVVASYDGGTPYPIASLTKLITAMVVLDTNPEWNRTMTYQKSDERPGAKLRLRIGDQLSVRDLWYSMLLGSANNAAIALARSTGLSTAEFVRRMNRKAEDLDLVQTRFTEPTGLDAENVSTAEEYARLANAAMQLPRIAETTKTRKYSFRTKNQGILHTLRNTNTLLGANAAVVGGKTGYLDEVGYNLMLKTVYGRTDAKKTYIGVVFGSKTSGARFRTLATLTALASRLSL